MVVEIKEVLKQAIFATILQALETEVRREEKIMTITGNRMANFCIRIPSLCFQFGYI